MIPKFTTYTDPAQAMNAALASGHIRVCIAKTPEGKYVACSRRTATKWGWPVECKVYGDPRQRKTAE